MAFAAPLSEMPLSAIISSASDASEQKLAAASSASQSAMLSEGYNLWLRWLQRLLSAHNLTIFSCKKYQNQLHLTPMASLSGKPVAGSLTQLAKRCASSCSTISALSDASNGHSVVCVPELVQADQPHTRHVLTIERQKENSFDAMTQARLVAWGFQSLEHYLSMGAATPADAGLLSWSLNQVERNAASASVFTQLMNTLRDESISERCVFAGLKIRHGSVTAARLLAVSGQPNISKKLPSSDAMLSGIEQAFANQSLPLSMVFEDCVEPALPAMSPISAKRPPCSRMVIPISLHQQWFAVSLERDATRPYTPVEQKRLEKDVTAGVVMTLLSHRKALSVSAAISRRIRQLYSAITVSLPRVVAISLAGVLIALILVYPVEHRVSAPLSVEASERHVLIAPSDGFVKTVATKVGDVVAQGDDLAALDDRDLKLELRKLESEATQNQQAYARALASRNRVDITRLKEEAAHIDTRLLQLNAKLERMKLKAPVDGVILSGSLDDFLGAAVAAGDTLFLLGSTHSHRLVLNVSEYDVKDIRVGQSVGIRLSADPSEVLSATVSAIMPLTLAEEGTNSVQVHAALDRKTQLRPGMQGVGKVLVGRQSRLLLWLKRITARLTWLAWKTGVIK